MKMTNYLVKFWYRLEALWRIISSKDAILIAVKHDGEQVVMLSITTNKSIDSFIDKIPISKLKVTKNKGDCFKSPLFN